MLKDMQGESVDTSLLDDALSQVAKRFNLDPKTVGDVRSMATRVLSGESITSVVESKETDK
jgi:hypothetical protein